MSRVKYGISFLSSDPFNSTATLSSTSKPNPVFRPAPATTASAGGSIDIAGSFLLDVNQRVLKVVEEVMTQQYSAIISNSTNPNNDEVISQLISAYDLFPEEIEGGDKEEEVPSSGRGAPIATLIEAWRQSLALNDRNLASSTSVKVVCDYKPERHYYETDEEKSRVNEGVEEALHWWGIRPEPLLLTEIVQRCPKRPPPPPPPPPAAPPVRSYIPETTRPPLPSTGNATVRLTAYITTVSDSI